jgi:outer membrane cobalamin receptor
MSRVVFAVILTGLAGSASAQSDTSPPQAPLGFRDSVIVTAERGDVKQSWIPAATVAMDAVSLRALPAVSLGEFLSFIPGFRVQQPALHGGRPVVSARGFFGGGEAEYVALLVDGVRVSDAESGLIDWSTMPASALTRIEAARGPGASLYGDAAVGGVIQILTDSPTGGALVTVSGGSLGTFSIDGTWRWRKTAAGGFVAGAARRTSGISDHSDTSELTLGSAVSGTMNPVSWRWTANVLARGQEDPGVLTPAQRDSGVTLDPLFKLDDRNRRTLLTALSMRSSVGSWTQQSRVSGNLRHEDGIRTILLAPGLGDTRSRGLATSGVAGTFELERPLGATPNSTLRIGVDVERQHLATDYFNVLDGAATGAAIGRADGSRVRAGAFASTSWMPASAVRLFGALRWDRIADSDFGRRDTEPTQAWSPRAGVVVQPAWLAGASVFAQYSRAFKAPTLDQMFDPRPYPDFRGGSFTISNALLTAQRASNVETGVSGGNRARWSVLAYRMNVENEIDFDARTFSYGNIGQSRHVGIEGEVQGPASARVRPIASYALSTVTANGAGGRQLKNVPRHEITVGASAALPWNVETFAALRRTWGAFLDDDNAVPVRSGVLVDLRLRRRIRRAEVFADLLNVLDRRYDEFGFVLADFRGGQVPYVYPGQPRVLRVGLTLDVR